MIQVQKLSDDIAEVKRQIEITTSPLRKRDLEKWLRKLERQKLIYGGLL